MLYVILWCLCTCLLLWQLIDYKTCHDSRSQLYTIVLTVRYTKKQCIHWSTQIVLAAPWPSCTGKQGAGNELWRRDSTDHLRWMLLQQNSNRLCTQLTTIGDYTHIIRYMNQFYTHCLYNLTTQVATRQYTPCTAICQICSSRILLLTSLS